MTVLRYSTSWVRFRRPGPDRTPRGEQALRYASHEQQAVDGALIASQHVMACAGRHREAVDVLGRALLEGRTSTWA